MTLAAEFEHGSPPPLRSWAKPCIMSGQDMEGYREILGKIYSR